MTNKVLDIFKQERGRTFIVDYSRNLEEQRTLSFVSKAVRPPKARPHEQNPGSNHPAVRTRRLARLTVNLSFRT